MTAELNAAWDELQAVEAEVSAALAKAARLAAEVPPEVTQELDETPIEELLRGMIAAREQADVDRKQVARLIAIVKRLEDGAAVVATDLAAAQHRADVAPEDPGAAADASSKSP